MLDVLDAQRTLFEARGQYLEALARIVLPNGSWQPGLFVTGHVVVQDVEIPLLIPETAVQTLEERPTVFVEAAEGWKPQPVTLGRSNDTQVESAAGLTPR